MTGGFRAYARGFLRNLRESDEPFARKVAKTIRNRAIATTGVRGGCCGHPGEPGC